MRAFAMSTISRRCESAHHMFRNIIRAALHFWYLASSWIRVILYFGCRVLLNGSLVALLRDSFRRRGSGRPRVSLTVDRSMHAAKNTEVGTLLPLPLHATLQCAATWRLICDRALTFERQTAAKVSRKEPREMQDPAGDKFCFISFRLNCAALHPMMQM